MTTYLSSEIGHGDEIASGPDADVLEIDSGSLSAGDFTLAGLPDNGSVLWMGAGIRRLCRQHHPHDHLFGA